MITVENGRLVIRRNRETVWIEPWGRDALRVRATQRAEMLEEPWALLETPDNSGGALPDAEGACVTNGKIRARVGEGHRLRFENTRGETLLEEYYRDRDDLSRYCLPLNIKARELKPVPGQDAFRLTARFEAQPDEKIFGLGQYQDGLLDKKGCVLELAHRNTQCSVPFAVSSRGYGFLWNNPAIGRVSFAANMTEWVAESTLQLDYWICAGDGPADILAAYCRATGFPPEMPEYGLGYWQCKLRYITQDELLAVARELNRRGLPPDVMVADFFHWTRQGDFRFDPECWPDPEGMIRELNEMGAKLMVSVWPTIDKESENFKAMSSRGLLVGVDRGMGMHMDWMGSTVFFDATHPEARQYIWDRVKENYIDRGVELFWLDEAEPEYGHYDFDIQRHHIGPANQVGNIYPAMYSKAFYDGMRAEGRTAIVNLVRAAWAGSQRYGALVWSGDIYSSFRSMREQLAAGLSMAMSGIPWWTSDIGGFHGGSPDDPAFRELVLRWFAWGAFCPVFRMHGHRMPHMPPKEEFRNGVRQFGTGAPNEIWSYGEKAAGIMEGYIRLRNEMRPYLRTLMEEAHKTGAPPMRPLFYVFPRDSRCWQISDAYMLGGSLLVAPVLEAGAKTRAVYLPEGASWTESATGLVFQGGQTVEAHAPIEVIPLFLRDGAQIAGVSAGRP